MRAGFRKVDIERAVSAVKAAGCEVISVRIRRDGTIEVLTAQAGDLTNGPGADLNPWDRTCAAE